MIELTAMTIDQYNGIIEARKKVFSLARDVKMQERVATYYATMVSELLHVLLGEQPSTEVKLSFSKSFGYYYLHVFILCPEATFQRIKKTNNFHDLKLHVSEAIALYIELKLIIQDASFIPTKEFLHQARERLLLHSGGEMLQEIRQKNMALMKALNDLKTSTDMIQAEKMRALGSMTAGVAHELNNPMMGILNFIQYAIKHTDINDRRYRPLTEALHEINRCQDIITNLLTFSRMKAEGEEEFSTIKLSLLIERILELQAYQLKSSNTVIIKHYPENEPQIKIKENKMQQVILNLVTNALAAMKDSEKKELILTIEVQKEHIIYSICDTGTGIDEETLDKIFEPFFTTKQAGDGTGLGLAVSKSIVEEHRGSLLCRSEVGKGTCFYVTVPRGD